MTETSEKITYQLVVGTDLSLLRVMEANMSLDNWRLTPTCNSRYKFIDQSFRPTWRVK